MDLNKFEEVKVLAYSGYRHNEKPLEITYRNRKMFITKILDKTHEELYSSAERVYRFRVLCEGNKIFILLYYNKKDQWFISTLS